MRFIKQLCLLSFIFLLTFVLSPVVVSADTTFTSSTALEDAAVLGGGIYNLTAVGSPYIFNNGIYVSKNVTINVEPGVQIIIKDNFSLQIWNGNFNALGTVDNPINITASSSRFGQVRFGDAVNTVKVNLENVNISKANYCALIARSVTTFTNVNLNDCSTVPVHISIVGDNNVTLDNIKYNKITTPSTNNLFYMPITTNVNSLHPVNIQIKNSDFLQNTDYTFRILDQSLNTFDPASVYIKINNNIFLGVMKDARPFNIDTNSKTIPIDAKDNYWGDSSGPYVENTLPKTLGPQVPINVNFIPFKTRDPKTILECCSSVLFIPGMQGSRLYQDRALGGTDQLWEANWKSDLSDLMLDQNGNTINGGVYTQDVVDRTNIGDSVGVSQYNKDIYKDTLSYLQGQKDGNIINSFKIYPYDWRIDFDEIINNGTKVQGGGYSKLIDNLHEQANLSSTGKVIIMAHSMGGLLTKRFIQSLSPADQALIDKVVFIATPQIGTPEGNGATLNGIAFEDFYRLVLPQRYNRKLAENMISAQTLGVSDMYFNIVNEKPIVFNSNLNTLLPSVSVYNGSIDTGVEMQSFLKGLDGRADAVFENVSYPNISPTVVVDRAKELHDQMDHYDIPSSIKVFQIVGTGMPTIKQIEYLEKTTPGGKYIDYNIKNSLSGDGTVVKESANYLVGDTYYINLNKYNTDTKNNYDHKNISGIVPVTGIISNIIKNEIVSTNTYVSTTGDLFDTVKLFTLGMHSPVDIHIYDNLNNHTGPVYVDINGEIVRFIEENISNMSYNEYGEDKYITGLDNQVYTIKLDGYAVGSFTMDLQRSTGDTPTTYESFNNLPATDLLASTIPLAPDVPIGSIILDTNGDNLPDWQAKNDGTLIDLNKPIEDICKIEKEKDNKKIKGKDKEKEDKDKEKKCKKEKKEKEDKDKHDKKENHKKSKEYHEKHKDKEH